MCCYLYEQGKAVRTPLQVRPGDGSWIEVAMKQSDGQWTELTGKEEVILADLSELSDGMKVRVSP